MSKQVKRFKKWVSEHPIAASVSFILTFAASWLALILVLTLMGSFLLGSCGRNWTEEEKTWDEKQAPRVPGMSCIEDWDELRPVGVLQFSTEGNLGGPRAGEDRGTPRPTICWTIGSPVGEVAGEGWPESEGLLGWECCSVLATEGPAAYTGRDLVLLADTCIGVARGGSR